MTFLGGIMSRHAGIRGKIIILVMLITLPLISVRLFTISQDYSRMITQELDAYEDLAKVIASAVNNEFDGILSIMDLTLTFLVKNPDMSPESINIYLSDIVSAKGLIENISWADSMGKVRYSSQSSLIGVQLNESTYYKKLMEGEDAVISDVVPSPVQSGINKITVSSAYRKNGVLEGFMMALIDLNALKESLPLITPQSGTEFLLVDRSGNLVFVSSKEESKPFGQQIDKNITNAWKAFDGEIVRESKGLYPFKENLNLSVSCPVASTGWVCSVFSNYDKVVANFNRDLIISCIAIGLMLIIVFVGGYYISMNILKPLIVLRTSAKRLMNGDYTVRTNIRGDDELALTAQAFDMMAESIQNYDTIKTQHFTNLSHELKTPLNIIYSSVQLMETFRNTTDTGILHSKMIQQTKIIKQNCYRLMRLIGNLIDVSKHDSGFLKPHLCNFDIVKLVGDISFSVVKYAEEREILLDFSSSVTEKVIACDPDMIERVLLNLISNAIKFTDKKGQIHILVDESEGKIHISVEDTGVGIPEDKIPCIFERFKQVDLTLCRNHEGSGLGLYLVKALVEGHGGSLSVKSTLGEGTRFTVELPTSCLPDNSQAAQFQQRSSEKNGMNRVYVEFSDIYSVWDGNG